jgi:hypothetical protein
MKERRPGGAKYLSNAAWIVAFMALCAAWTFAVVRASYQSPSNGNDGWICPIAGKCGPPGTPGLGRW